MAWLDQLKDSLELPSDMQLAERAGIASPSVISGWRRGRTQPSAENLRKIAKLAGLPPIMVFRKAGVVQGEDLDGPEVAPDEPLPHQLRELVDLYRRADKATRTVILGQVEFLVNAMTKR
jgi:transcriptional regulator with XRE-family HTH domain